MAKVGSPSRGEIYLVNFDPTLGSEIRKTRPALVIQNNRKSIQSYYAITSKYDDKLYPTEVLILAGTSGLKHDSVILLNQIRSIDRQRLSKKIGKLTEAAIKVSLGLIEI